MLADAARDGTHVKEERDLRPAREQGHIADAKSHWMAAGLLASLRIRVDEGC